MYIHIWCPPSHRLLGGEIVRKSCQTDLLTHTPNKMHIIFPTLRPNEFSSAVAFVIVVVATAVTVLGSLFSWWLSTLSELIVGVPLARLLFILHCITNCKELFYVCLKTAQWDKVNVQSIYLEKIHHLQGSAHFACSPTQSSTLIFRPTTLDAHYSTIY